MKTRNAPSTFFILANQFWNSSIFVCSTAASDAAMKRKRVNTELFCNWLSQHGVLALSLLNLIDCAVTRLVATKHVRNKYSLLESAIVNCNSTLIFH